MILLIILIILASISNAIMDTLNHHHSLSIFKRFPGTFFAEDSWKNKYINRDMAQGRIKWDLGLFKINKPVQLTDAWHLFKSLQIIILISLIFIIPQAPNVLYFILYTLGAGILYNLIFSLFYHKLLLN